MKNIMPPINTPDNAFHDGNPATGEQGTIVPGLWLNNIQDATRNIQQELISVLTSAGIDIDEGQNNQLLLAIQKLISDKTPAASLFTKGIVQLSSSTTSTSETLAATPKAVKAALDASLPIGGTAASATKLATARKIGGVDFDGTKDITLPFINTTDTNIQLAGGLGVKNLEVHPMPNSTEGGEIDFFDKDDVRAAFLDIDTAGNFRVVVDTLGVAISVNRTNRNVAITSELTVTGNVSAGGGQSLLATTGDVSGPKWGGSLYDYLANRDIGIPIPYPLASVPAGYLKCNGATFSTSTYPKLALKYPSGVLPDLRANAIRGWDDGRGVDAGRVLLSQQDDAIRNITGIYAPAGGKAAEASYFSGAFTRLDVPAPQGGQVVGGSTVQGAKFDASLVVPTASENRMKNIAFNYIVRAL
ncbi:TPA: tail fiber protein [Yersinia enterocolitica]|nr:tail fiber protein [Yersinia enterocolitica]